MKREVLTDITENTLEELNNVITSCPKWISTRSMNFVTLCIPRMID